MTLRSILLGLMGAVCLCAVGFYNDQIVHNTPLMGDYFPFAIFGFMILCLLLSLRGVLLVSAGVAGLCLIGIYKNQLASLLPFLPSPALTLTLGIMLSLLLVALHRSIPRTLGRKFTIKELAIMVALPLLVGWIPGKGFMRSFNAVLVMPHRLAVERPGWQASPTDYQVSDIRDPARLLHLLGNDQDGESIRVVMTKIPADNRNSISNSVGSSNLPPELAETLIASLNQTLADPALYAIAMKHPDKLPVNLRSRLTTSPSPDVAESDRRVAVRTHLDQVFAGALESRWPALLENVSPNLLVSTNANFATVVDGYRSGLGQEQSHAAVRDVPWYAWVTPYQHWLPGILLFCIVSVGIAMAVHREWSDHEHLPYPTVTFLEALLPSRTGETNSTFKQRLFWISFFLIAGIHIYNYTARSWGYYQYLVPITLRFGFGPISDMFPILKHGHDWVVFSPRVFFVVVGLAYFLASEVSLSLAISPVLYLFILGMATTYGISFGGDAYVPDIETFIYGGSYLGLFLVVAWTGRHYYSRIFRHATGLIRSATQQQDILAVCGARMALFATVLLTLWMVYIGVEWSLAIPFVALLIATHIVMARVLAEGGVIWFGPGFVPSALLWGFFGARGIGPDQLLLLGLVSSMLMMNPTVAMMPLASSAIRLLDRAQAPIGRTLLYGGFVLLLGFAVAIVVTLYTQYDRGVIRINDGWATQTIPPKVYDANLIARQRLDAQGLLHSSGTADLKSRISNFKLERPAVVAMGVTLALVLLFTYFRHRFTNWPLHPILFLALGTWSAAWLGFSFFLGWLTKSLVTRYGGASLYHRLKPLMIGMIAGEMVGVTIPAIISTIYFLITGEHGKHYILIPH